MKTLEIPEMPGLEKMTPLMMNTIHFDKKHTILTPEVLESLGKKQQATAKKRKQGN